MGANGQDERLRRAVFLDRDGVINRNIFYTDSGAYESPRNVKDFALLTGVTEALTQLRSVGFLLFVVSNQPNYAKGKSTLAELEAINTTFQREMRQAGIEFAAIHYCLHHPEGITPSYSKPCVCRKPSPHFLLKDIRNFALDPSHSWMVGDRPTDVACGRAAGVQTVFIGEAPHSCATFADHTATDLPAACTLICSNAKAYQPQC